MKEKNKTRDTKAKECKSHARLTIFLQGKVHVPVCQGLLFFVTRNYYDLMLYFFSFAV
jgi:hypothetical protein